MHQKAISCSVKEKAYVQRQFNPIKLPFNVPIIEWLSKDSIICRHKIHNMLSTTFRQGCVFHQVM